MRGVWLGVLLLACVRAPPMVGEPGASVENTEEEEAYRETLARYSDRAEIYGGFDTRIFAGITFQTLPFREARVRRRASFQALPEAKVQALLAEERAQAAESHEFLFGVHASDPALDDFDRKKSIWRIALLTPTGEVTPSSIERIGRSSADLRAYYPALGEFWVAYRVRFPKQFADGTSVIPEGAREVTFRVASTAGQADLTVAAQ